MKAISICVATAALLLAAPNLARAADMLETPYAAEAAETYEPEVGSNWYIRGDIGYVVNGDFSLTTDTGTLSDVNLDDTFTAGAGVGYDFGWFRADLTGDYAFNADVSARRDCADVVDCPSRESAELNIFTGLINGYFDLGTWSGFTPYIGAGVGVAYVDFTEGWRTVPATGDNYRNVAVSDWRVAWALNAGLNYAITGNLSMDVGYRLVGIEDGSVVKNFRDSADVSIGKIDYEDLYNHEFRVGFRYMID
jgi:opacity protein-like surface antigen